MKRLWTAVGFAFFLLCPCGVMAQGVPGVTNTTEPIRTFTGHTDGVWSVAFSPDGKSAVSGARDNTVRLWEVSTGREIRAHYGHTQSVHAVAFSPDGQYILSGSADSMLKLWEVATGREVRTFQGHTNGVYCVAFSPNGTSLASAAFDNTVKLWEVSTGREVRTFRGHTNGVSSVAFSPDGRFIVSGSRDKTLKLWDVSTGQEIRTFPGHPGWVQSVAFGPDGQYVLSGSADSIEQQPLPAGTVKLWEASTGKEIHSYSAGHNIFSVAFSPNGRYVLVALESVIKLYTVPEFREVQVLHGNTFVVNAAVFSPDGRYVLSGGHDNALKLWQVSETSALPGIITTFAGSTGFSGDEGPATQARLTAPKGIAADIRGNIYIADTGNNRIRCVRTDGSITTFAGGGNSLADQIAAKQASLNRPSGVATDAKGNVYIADTNNHRILRVDLNNTITILAGTGNAGYSGDGELAMLAHLNLPSDVTVDAEGMVYIADTGNHRIRRVNPDGTLITVAGTGAHGYTGDGGPAEYARLNAPHGVTVDTQGVVYIADTGNHRIRRIDLNGVISTFAGTGQEGYSGDGPATQASLSAPHDVAVDTEGNVYIADTYIHFVRVVDSDGMIRTPPPAGYAYPHSVAVDTSGNVYITDTGHQRVLRMNREAVVTLFAGKGGFWGDGGPAALAGLSAVDVAVDIQGNLYVAEGLNHRVRRVAPDGTIATFAGTGDPGYSGDGGPARQANLHRPNGVAVDGRGAVYIVDMGRDRVRRVSPEGVITTFAGTGDSGYSGDGGPAALASLTAPEDVAVDASGNVYIADTGNLCVRRVGNNGTITTFAGGGYLGDGVPATQAFLSAFNVAVDAQGIIYISDREQHVVRRVGSDGIVTIFAGTGRPGYSGDGGSATQASLNQPKGVAVDAGGNVYIADAGNHVIRRVSPNGVITTFAGTGDEGFSGDGGLATYAELSEPAGVAVDVQGNVYIADEGNFRVRRVSVTDDGTIPNQDRPLISLSASILTFAATNSGSTPQSILTVSNMGSAELSVTGIAVGGTNASLFTMSPTALSIGLGQSRDVTITYHPQMAGQHTAVLTIFSNDATQPQRTVSLSATALEPNAPLPELKAAESAIDFGAVGINVKSEKRLLIKNAGQADLTIGGISSSDEHFRVSVNALTIAAGDSATFTITFTPSASASYSGTLTVLSNDPKAPSYTIGLSGTGKELPKQPDIAVLPSLLNFGAVRLGQTKTLNLIVSNEGSETLQVINIVSSSQDFVVSETGFSLNAGEKKTLSITFLPSFAGAVSELLDLPSNDPDERVVQVSLRATVSTGTGGMPSIAPMVTLLEFGEVGATGVAELNLPIRNEGTATLNVSNVVSKDLQVAVIPTSLSIPPQERRVLTVYFRPRPGRARSGEIVINCDDPNRPALKIPWEAVVSVVEQALSVVLSTPEMGDAGISQQTELAVRFSEPLLTSGRFVAVDAQLIPLAESGPLLDGLTLVENGAEAQFSVKLKANTFYRLVISSATGRSGAKLLGAFEVGFFTGSTQVSLGSIAGTVAFDDGRAFEGTVVLFNDMGDLLNRQAIGSDGTYSVANLPEGKYRVFADVFAEGAGAVSRAYDKNGDGRPDEVLLGSGQNATGVDVSLKATAASPADTTGTPPPPVNEGASVALDVDGASGDQSKTTLTGVQAEDEILVCVYALNTVEVAGYTVTLAYDSTQVSFKRVDEGGADGEKNLLAAAGGSAVFIRTPPEKGKVGMAGAILGPTSETTPSGNGLLGVFRFVAQEGFSEAKFSVSELIMQSGGVTDTVSVTAEATASSASGPGPSPGPGEEIVGPIQVDLNASDGNQELKTKTGVKAGDTVTVQLFSDGFPEVIGYGFNIEYDANALAYVAGSFAPGDFIAGATPLDTDKGGYIEVGAASLTGVSASGDGYLGKVDFILTDAFADSTYVAVTSVGFSLKEGGVQEQVVRVIGRLQAGNSGLMGDFDGNGSVGFTDFLMFAQAFGGTDSRFDLDGNGSVGFTDFLMFAGQFGKSAR